MEYYHIVFCFWSSLLWPESPLFILIVDHYFVRVPEKTVLCLLWHFGNKKDTFSLCCRTVGELSCWPFENCSCASDHFLRSNSIQSNKRNINTSNSGLHYIWCRHAKMRQPCQPDTNFLGLLLIFSRFYANLADFRHFALICLRQKVQFAIIFTFSMSRTISI